MPTTMELASFSWVRHHHLSMPRCRQEPDSDDELYDETQEIPETLGVGDVDSQGVSNGRSPGSNRWVGTGLYHIFGHVLWGSSLTLAWTIGLNNRPEQYGRCLQVRFLSHGHWCKQQHNTAKRCPPHSYKLVHIPLDYRYNPHKTCIYLLHLSTNLANYSAQPCVDGCEILHQMVTIGNYETLQMGLWGDTPFINGCRISSVEM